jgi:hypothetical protein
VGRSEIKKMDCEEILEDVIAFCKKEIEALENTTIVDNPQDYDSLHTLRGLRDAYENVINRIAIKRAQKMMASVRRTDNAGVLTKAPYRLPLYTSCSKVLDLR